MEFLGTFPRIVPGIFTMHKPMAFPMKVSNFPHTMGIMDEKVYGHAFHISRMPSSKELYQI